MAFIILTRINRFNQFLYLKYSIHYVNNLKIKKAKNKGDLNNSIKIRKNVFIKEQKVPISIELDGFDSEAEHFIAYLKERPIGCARIRTNKNYAKLERIAIVKEYRGKGFGTQLTRFLMDYCKQNNFHEVRLHSQTYVSDFYKKLGFKTIGKTFFEAGIEHVEMSIGL